MQEKKILELSRRYKKATEALKQATIAGTTPCAGKKARTKAAMEDVGPDKQGAGTGDPVYFWATGDTGHSASIILNHLESNDTTVCARCL